MKPGVWVCLLAGALAPTLSAAGPADALVGTWKMNVAKSQFNPGPAPKSVTVTYSRDGDWVVSKADAVDASGKNASRTNRFKMDGKEYPYDGPNGKGTIRYSVAGERSFSTVTNIGKGTVTTEHALSADGKTRTQTGKGVNAEGKPVSNRIVWDKQ